MKHLRLFSLLFVALLFTKLAVAQELYSAAFGDEKDPAIIFLHGGPGYNSFSFEGSTAERLASEGYYVIVFDQRGCGRSDDMDGSQYTFAEAVADIDNIYKEYGVKKATLLGHSWGGALGVVYAEQHPEKVNALVLVAAPMDYQQTFKAILKNSRAAYAASGKTDQFKYLDMLDQMDPASLKYANYCFLHAMASGLYTAKSPADNAKDIYADLMTNPDAPMLQKMTEAPVSGFYNNEHYTTLNIISRVALLKQTTAVYGIFGSDDGLFDSTQLAAIEQAIGTPNMTVVNGASHSVFIDQQDVFLQTLIGNLKQH